MPALNNHLLIAMIAIQRATEIRSSSAYHQGGSSVKCGDHGSVSSGSSTSVACAAVVRTAEAAAPAVCPTAVTVLQLEELLPPTPQGRASRLGHQSLRNCKWFRDRPFREPFEPGDGTFHCTECFRDVFLYTGSSRIRSERQNPAYDRTDPSAGGGCTGACVN